MRFVRGGRGAHPGLFAMLPAGVRPVSSLLPPKRVMSTAGGGWPTLQG